MKKIIILFMSLSLVFSLSACSNTDTKPTISGADEVNIKIDTSFSALEGVTATDKEDGDVTKDITTSGNVDTTKMGIYTVTYNVKDSDGNEFQVVRTVNVVGLNGCPIYHDMVDGTCIKKDPEKITIMHGAVYEIDPFHDSYSGTEQFVRQALQREVEAKYNVIINYKNYPSSAAWGPLRVSAINQASVAGEPLSDIYWVTSNWIQDLVKGDSITSVSDYMNDAGKNIPDAYGDIGEYQGSIYGFESYRPTATAGLYYNADLIADLGVENPTDLYLEGKWNWSKFETWSTTVQTALDSQPDDMYALGGMPSYYAEHMIPLNGGSLINKQTGSVAFEKIAALETYSFVTNLWEKGLFEPNGGYDSGSPEWQGGKVVMHPGDLWFLNSAARWGGLSFGIGYVPYPVADDFTGEYTQPISGVSLMTIASGMSTEREELVFTVWNELQLVDSDAEAAMKFKMALITKFDDIDCVDAYMTIYDKVYLDILNAVGVGAYSESGWTSNINRAIKDGTSRTAVDQIRPTYERALEKYLGTVEED
jgi:maltose-binding protein MalE